MKIECIPVSAMCTNCYVLYNEDTNEAILIDPGDYSTRIDSFIESLSLDVCAIILTHGHFDHIIGVEKYKEKYKVPVIAAKSELDLLEDAILNVSARVRMTCTVSPDILVDDLQVMEIASTKLQFIFTPGHTAGSMCIYDADNKYLISGDTLFREGIGRSDLPTGDGDTLFESIYNKLFCLPDDTICYPGHGDSTTIGYEKVNNPYL